MQSTKIFKILETFKLIRSLKTLYVKHIIGDDDKQERESQISICLIYLSNLTIHV